MTTKEALAYMLNVYKKDIQAIPADIMKEIERLAS